MNLQRIPWEKGTPKSTCCNVLEMKMVHGWDMLGTGLEQEMKTEEEKVI